METPIQTIHGAVPSKSNSYKIVTIGGHASLAKTKSLKEYEQRFYLQCGIRDLKINKFFKLEIQVYNADNRKDLDNSLKIVLDCLQSCKAITNDRLCTVIQASKHVDKIDPRIEFRLIEEL